MLRVDGRGAGGGGGARDRGRPLLRGRRRRAHRAARAGRLGRRRWCASPPAPPRSGSRPRSPPAKSRACVTRSRSRPRSTASTGPEWRLPVLWVEVIGDDDYRVYLGALPFPILVRSQEVARRIDLLEQLRPAILERAPILAEVDLRFESRVIVRPATRGDRGRERRRPRSRGRERRAAPIATRGAGRRRRSRMTSHGKSTRSSVWDPQPKET